MGARARHKPKRLAEKLTQIRTSLGLSQNELIRRLGAEETLTQNKISSYELGTGEPSLITLLLYARAANVAMEAIIDDDLDLPARLPSAKKSEGVRRRA
ncbi:MAG TPA: helix-turn-helix transcriptional regulator [Pyrinomonadaceae bacterium]|jgi:transcriptional regulator with XRE-family HTH domain|nr:helix-turn-helix transcriptional regulator [Pyrinomonadaceae bacterium]